MKTRLQNRNDGTWVNEVTSSMHDFRMSTLTTLQDPAQLLLKRLLRANRRNLLMVNGIGVSIERIDLVAINIKGLAHVSNLQRARAK